MKSTKRFIAVVIALALVMSFGTTVFADTTNDGSITIRNTTKDETYTIYKIFDLTYAEDEDGNHLEKDANGNVTGVSYTYTTADADNDALYAALTATGSPFTLTPTTTAGVYNVELTSGKTATDVATFFNGLDKEVLPTATATAAGTGADLKFEGLAYGYYYIESSLGATVTVDSTLKDVTVVDKNEGPTWDNETPNPEDPEKPIQNGKVIIDTVPHCGLEESNEEGGHTHNEACYKVTSNEINIGDTVNFSIAVNATAYVGEDLVTYYYVTDTLGDGFELDKTSISVKVGGTAITDYTITYAEETQSFRINIPFGEKYGSNAKIEVTYSATLTKDAVIGEAGNPNTANFAYATDPTFDPDEPGYDPENPTDPDYPEDPTVEYPDPENPDEEPTPKPYEPENPGDTPDEPGVTPGPGGKKETETYTYAIGVKKVAETEDGAALAGATFSLKMVKDADGNTLENPVVIKATVDTTTGSYTFSTADGAVDVFATNDGGLLAIKGLVPGTYEITEVDHPAGYNPLTEPKTVVINKNAKDADNSILEVNEAVVETVVNKSGVELPSTGGTGTALLIGVGSVLFLAAALVLVTKKRMYNAG